MNKSNHTLFLGTISTRHASIRAKERLGISKESTKRMSERALLFGIRAADVVGRLRKYLQYKQNGFDIIRVYGEFVYVFNIDKILITIFRLPKDFLKQAAKCQRRIKKLRVEKVEMQRSNSINEN